MLPVGVQCRVIVDNDWAGDPDGLVALAHHLLSPTNKVTAVTSSFLNPMFGPSAGTAERGAAMARELVELIGTEPAVPVTAGADLPFLLDRPISDAAALIVEQARRVDELRLFLVCGGPLTNVAEALRHAPDIADRLTLVWIGGSREPDVFEYNRDTDADAAAFVFAAPDLAIWQFPIETYLSCAYSVAELEHDLSRGGALGAWLWERFVTLPLPPEVQIGGVWALGDSPPLLVTALNDTSSTFVAGPSANVHAERRIYTRIDARLIIGDMNARLRLHARRRDAAVT